MGMHACSDTNIVRFEGQKVVVSKAFGEMNRFVVELLFVFLANVCLHLFCAHDCFGLVQRE